jgi:hypothetical protein
MKRSLPVALLLMFLVQGILPASEFDWLVREFSRESGINATRIPLFGFVRAAVAITHPAGASQLNLAIFEHATMEPQRFRILADSVVGSSWKPMIRVTSRKGESTNIYSRPDQNEMRLLILSLDHSDATFVQVRVEPQRLMSFIDEHGGLKHR